MSKPLKYFLVALASFLLLLGAAALIVPALVDVNRYKPEIEQLVAEKTGYSLSLGGDIDISLFPWVGLSFTDLRLDNPDGFENREFVLIDAFQARFKLIPLLSRRLEVSRFVVNRPEIYLEKNRAGVWNWNQPAAKAGGAEAPGSGAGTGETGAAGPAGAPDASPPPAVPGDRPPRDFALQALVVEEFSISEGRIVLQDMVARQRREISALSLQLTDVSLDKPIQLSLQARLDDRPLNLQGSIGPLGPDPRAGRTDLNLTFEAFETVSVNVAGFVEEISTAPEYHLAFKVAPFSPKRLYDRLGLTFPFSTTDPAALETVELEATLSGTVGHAELTEARIVLDDSLISLTAAARDFRGPDLAFDLKIDKLDVDRYLPPADKTTPDRSPPAPESGLPKEGAGSPGNAGTTAGTQPLPPADSPSTAGGAAPAGQTDSPKMPATVYEPLRRLVVDGTAAVGALKIHGGTVSNLALAIDGANGQFNLTSLTMDLYEGALAASGRCSVQKEVPETSVKLELDTVQVGPLLRDFTGKDMIEGRLKADLAVSGRGDSAELLKKTLNGSGDLLFQDGAVLGLDLAQLARNIKSGFTLEQQGERPKTDFAELHAPLTITAGVIHTPETILKSPFIRVQASGDADLVHERLDLKLKPTIVGTIKGQGDEEKRSGLTVPVLVGGTFSDPEFRPDLETLVKDQIPDERELGDIIKTGEITPERKEQFKEEIEKTKGLLKNLFGN